MPLGLNAALAQVRSALDNFGALFLLTSLHLARAKEGAGERLKEQINIIKELHELNLAPDKEAALKKYREDLKATLAAPPSHETGLKSWYRALPAKQGGATRQVALFLFACSGSCL